MCSENLARRRKTNPKYQVKGYHLRNEEEEEKQTINKLKSSSIKRTFAQVSVRPRPPARNESSITRTSAKKSEYIRFELITLKL